MNGRDSVRGQHHVLSRFKKEDYGRQGADFESEPVTRDVSVITTHLVYIYNIITIYVCFLEVFLISFIPVL